MKSKSLSPGDPGSYSRPDQIIVTHMHVKLDCNFDKRVLKGEVILTLEKQKEDIDTLLLDTRDLSILQVTNGKDGATLKFFLDEPFLSFGQKLTIYLPAQSTLKYTIVIDYVTSSKSTALQWLSPEQTLGKEFPYLFTQCQPDHCRSMIPCQDTPSVKSPFTAQVTIPKRLTALMSAVIDGDCTLTSDGKKECKFKQTVPVPAYLIALAVGDLEGRKVGPRSTIWSEPKLIEAAAYEFAETDVLLKTAEDICGPYVWHIYDLLVLPPSFPFGGMENPCLTFITPTLIAGDRSLVTVVAHEIAHSWTGNLVSIVNFQHFWLNEGFTMFIERKINGRLKGEAYRQFNAISGLKDLKQAVSNYLVLIRSRLIRAAFEFAESKTNDTNYAILWKDSWLNFDGGWEQVNVLGEENPLTKLVVDLDGIDPDEAFSVCPYEKGFTFLYYLEHLLGGPNVFEAFLRSYFEKFKYKSVSTEDFKNYLCDYFKDNKHLDEIEWEKWLFTPGMPYKIPEYDTTLQLACVSLITKWQNWNISDPFPFSLDDLKSLMIEQIEEFTALLLEADLPLDKLKHIDKIYNMSSYTNCEIKFRWLRICVNAKWSDKVDDALKFATEQGRMKYTRPIFRDLYKWEEMREKAIKSFQEHKASMMFVLVKTLEIDLHLNPINLV